MQLGLALPRRRGFSEVLPVSWGYSRSLYEYLFQGCWSRSFRSIRRRGVQTNILLFIMWFLQPLLPVYMLSYSPESSSSASRHSASDLFTRTTMSGSETMLVFVKITAVDLASASVDCVQSIMEARELVDLLSGCYELQGKTPCCRLKVLNFPWNHKRANGQVLWLGDLGARTVVSEARRASIFDISFPSRHQPGRCGHQYSIKSCWISAVSKPYYSPTGVLVQWSRTRVLKKDRSLLQFHTERLFPRIIIQSDLL